MCQSCPGLPLDPWIVSEKIKRVKEHGDNGMHSEDDTNSPLSMATSLLSPPVIVGVVVAVELVGPLIPPLLAGIRAGKKSESN